MKNENRELLTAVGIQMPSDFDRGAYERAWRSISSFPSSGARTEAGFGMNAVAYRFRQAAEADELFQRSVSADGDAPEPEARFRQECLLFDFFVAGQASLESICYSTYAVGSILKPEHFPMRNLRDISARATLRELKTTFSDHSLTDALNQLLRDPSWKEWNDLRNVLAHRSAPGRIVSLTVGESPEPAVWKVAGLLRIHKTLTADRRLWLANVMNGLMKNLCVLLEDETTRRLETDETEMD